MSQLDIGLDGVKFFMDVNGQITFNDIAQNAFLSALGLSDALTQTTADGRYLKTSGGTITGTLDINGGATFSAENGITIGNIKITYNAEKDSLDFTKVS